MTVSDEESIGLFFDETKNLESQIQSLSCKDTFSISEIVQAYYTTMNADSLATMMAEPR